MKIVFFDDRYHMVYGAQENTLLMAEWAADAGRDVLVMTTGEGPFAQSARQRGLDVRVVEAPGPLLRFDRSPLGGTNVERLRSAVAAARYNVTMCRELAAVGADLIVASTPRAALWLVLAAALRRPRMLLWVQGDERRRFMALVTGISAWRIGLIGESCSNLFSPRVRRWVEGKFRPLQSARDLTAFGERTATVPDEASGVVRLVSVASITYRKGFDVLLDALADLDTRDVRLTIVGGTVDTASEQYLHRLQRLAKRYRLDVDFVGWHDDVRPFLEAADVFVLASRSEGLPGVLLEAMAVGLPCVTTRSGDSGVLVEQCKAGLAVDIDDVDALSKAIAILIANPTARTRFGENGRRAVELRYSPEVCYAQFEAILAEVRDWSR